VLEETTVRLGAYLGTMSLGGNNSKVSCNQYPRLIYRGMAKYYLAIAHVIINVFVVLFLFHI
jgi:hypothetical protein